MQLEIRDSIVVNDTSYHPDTPKEVIKVLEEARQSHRRVRLFFGDQATGRDWLDTVDTTGTIGRSAGLEKSPLLIHNRRSIGGPSILTSCIVKIVVRADRCEYPKWKVAYQHPKYHQPEMVVLLGVKQVYPYEVLTVKRGEDGDVRQIISMHSSHKTREKATRYLKFLTGERMSP